MDAELNSDRVARSLLDLANSEPERVLDSVGDVERQFEQASESLEHTLGVSAWAIGLAYRNVRNMAESEQWLTIASGYLDAGSDDHTGAVLSLCGTLAYEGDFDRARALLDATAPSAEMAGRVEYQRAAIAERCGDIDTARSGYAASLDSFRATGDLLGEAHALFGIGLVEVSTGDAQHAVVNFGIAHNIYGELGLEVLSAAAQNNIGYAASHTGDTIGALRHLEAAEQRLSDLGEPFVEVALDRVETLTRLGLIDEAITRAVRVLANLQDGAVETDRAELLVGLARAFTTQGEPTAARRCLDTAARLFERQHRGHWCQVVRARTLELAAPATQSTVTELERIRSDLAGDDHVDAAADIDVALITTLRHLAADHCVSSAATRLAELAPTDHRQHLGAAVIAAADGRHGDAIRTVERSIIAAALHDQSSSISLDLAVGLMTQRRHAIATAVASCQSMNDARSAAAIIGLAQSTVLDRDTAGPQLDDAVVAALRQDPSTVDWRDLAATARNVPVEDTHLTDLLAMADVSATPTPLIIVADLETELVVIRIGPDDTMFVTAPDRTELIAAFERLHHALVAALSNGEAGIERVHRATQVVQSLLPWLSDGSPIDVCPTGTTSNFAWGAAATGPVRIVIDPHSTLERVAGNNTALAVGPGLVSAASEAAELGRIRGDLTVISDASRQDVIDQASNADTLHLCCHADHIPQNPLMSSYNLTDGDLTGFDIARAARAPRIVVSAACRSGQATGQHSVIGVGIATAWIAAGADSVIAPVCEIPDDHRTVDAIATIHESLTRGVTPQQALVDAKATGNPVASALQVTGRRLDAVDATTEIER